VQPDPYPDDLWCQWEFRLRETTMMIRTHPLVRLDSRRVWYYNVIVDSRQSTI
jgi:hypothetical protein